ncbi:uncharacterized protein LOC6577798 isoform X1 [Drosophila mojavensis]|uniref:Uncharacterized protein, isoform A n=2 Tax=Drosophila mojavensis TaxID=7230 RepID=B4KG34_DROMO|nr:uncharacterized protein LOC6577798 isoform X1 [Drosophila mojavensis]EDW13173.1 uncharacterized protein Dmoj_GI18070, isoform A [Drosophila mojavensis]
MIDNKVLFNSFNIRATSEMSSRKKSTMLRRRASAGGRLEAPRASATSLRTREILRDQHNDLYAKLVELKSSQAAEGGQHSKMISNEETSGHPSVSTAKSQGMHHHEVNAPQLEHPESNVEEKPSGHASRTTRRGPDSMNCPDLELTESYHTIGSATDIHAETNSPVLEQSESNLEVKTSGHSGSLGTHRRSRRTPKRSDMLKAVVVSIRKQLEDSIRTAESVVSCHILRSATRSQVSIRKHRKARKAIRQFPAQMNLYVKGATSDSGNAQPVLKVVLASIRKELTQSIKTAESLILKATKLCNRLEAYNNIT